MTALLLERPRVFVCSLARSVARHLTLQTADYVRLTDTDTHCRTAAGPSDEVFTTGFVVLFLAPLETATPGIVFSVFLTSLRTACGTNKLWFGRFVVGGKACFVGHLHTVNSIAAVQKTIFP